MQEKIGAKSELSIVISGEAGQGIDSVSEILAQVIKNSGYNVSVSKELMSRVRGGCNSTEIRVSSERVSAYVKNIDFLIPLSEEAFDHLNERISHKTIIFTDIESETNQKNKAKTINVPFNDLAKEIGGKIYSNTISAALILGLLEVDINLLKEYITKQFHKKDESVIQNNIKAAEVGFNKAAEILKTENLSISINKSESVKDEVLVTGYEAISMGAIAGGCNFISSYPMSPATGVLTFLSAHGNEFGIVAEQVEDEIAAINMALGAWYAGARAIVSTSGGGFALMEEGVSLAGMIETPIVIHIAQRPGPATGLPTRTAQEDLELSLYSGHGEFPRIILAPGNLKDAFYLSQQAFNLADEYQVPVFILSDQFLIDTYYNTTTFDPYKIPIKKHIIETKEDYKRYEITDNGLSPRGIPGYGKGLVCVDSDEHDESSHITENLTIRTKMAEKRLKKLDLIKQNIIEPELIGSKDYKTLVVGWGSTYAPIKEALEKLNRNDIAFLYFKQVYPLPDSILDYLNKAENTIILENNATGQFAKLIKLETGHVFNNKFLKYNGEPFCIEEVVTRLSEL